MASASALIRGATRRVSSEVAKDLGRLAKLAGTSDFRPINGFRIPIPGFPKLPPGPGFPPSPFPPSPTTPLPFTPQPPTGPRADLGGLCDLLPASLQAACRLIAGATAPQPPATPTRPIVAGPGGCPSGTIQMGTTCIDLTAIPPGGDPLTFPAGGGGSVVQGGFGLPATTPVGVSTVVRKCPRGMVLGIDDLCYAKAILPPRSKLRKWRRPPRPPISRRDTVAIRRAAGAKERVLELAKDVGLHVSKHAHRRKKK